MEQPLVLFGNFVDRNTTKMFFYKKNVYLEDENNEGLSRIPKWTQVFLHGFDKRTIAETLI